MQNEESQRYRCPKPTCQALPGAPCVTLDGREAGHVHHGRPDIGDRQQARAIQRARAAIDASPLRPTLSSPGIWIGSEFVSRSESIPYGAWVCSCGESRVAVSLGGVLEMNRAYADHASCRTPAS